MYDSLAPSHGETGTMTYIEGIVNQVFCHSRIHVQAGHGILNMVVHIGLSEG